MKKLVTAAALVITIFAGTVAVQAQETTVLTVDRAVHRAINNSESIRRLAENVVLEEISGRQLSQALMESTHESILLSTAIARMTHEIAMAFSHTDRTTQIALITQSVQQGFLAILNAEARMEFMEREIAIARQKHRFDRVRYEHGLLSVHDFNAAARAITNLEIERESLQTEINRAHRQLASIVGGGRTARFCVELELDFAPFTSRPVEDYVAITLAQNADLRRALRQLEVTRFEYEHRSARNDDDRTARTIEFNRAQRNVMQIREDLESSLLDLYDQIRAQERSLTILRAGYEAMLAQYEINAAMLDMERITQLAFDEFALGLDEMRHSITSAEAGHTLMVQRLRNPNLS
ncbi:MAG: hypothetical protein FWD98_04195 [Defluviitaleaceae bacterium]|nr:hypothetical protein [Defluviitaleaceae bacterium]